MSGELASVGELSRAGKVSSAAPRRFQWQFPGGLTGWQRLLPYALLLSVTFALYGASLFYNFVWDDQQYVLENFAIQSFSSAHLWRLWRKSYLSNYAPLHQMLLAIIARFSGLQPFGYHLAQLLLHAACVCLLYRLLKKMENARVALMACLLFAVFPANVETVAWISETKSTLAFALFLLSFWCFIRFREQERWSDEVLAGLLLALSCLSKINTAVAPAIFLLYDYRHGGSLRKRTRSLSVFFLLGALFIAIHLAVTYRSGDASAQRLIDSAIAGAWAPLAAVSHGYYGGLRTHLLNLPALLAFYARMVFYPSHVSAWHMFRLYSRLNWTLGALWLACAVALYLLLRSSRTVQFWGLWFLIFLAPVLQIIPNQIWVADRYLYIPAIGAFVLVSKAFFGVLDRSAALPARLICSAVAGAVLIAFSWQTLKHLPAWRNDLSLWQSTIPQCTDSAYCHYRLGEALLADGSNRGVSELERTVQIRPSVEYLRALGDAYSDRLGLYSRAHDSYRAAQTLARGNIPATLLASAAKAYYLQGDLAGADRVLGPALQQHPNNSLLLIVQAFSDWKRGRTHEARSSLQRALDANAENPLSAHPAQFLIWSWEHPAEVGKLMASLGPG